MIATGYGAARLGSRDALLAVAGALEREAAVRYRAPSARMRREADAASAAVAAPASVLRGAVDGLRLLETGFDRYAQIAERAADDRVVAEAQRLAADMVARLALAGGARHNTLLGVAAA